MKLELPLKGVIPPVITPLINHEELDHRGLKKLIEHLIAGGVHGLFLLGTTGEGPSLSYKLRMDFLKKACEIVGRRIPILVGISDTSFSASIEMATFSKSVGADAVVVAPPYYFPVAEEELIDYFENLSDLLTLPFLLYNIPSHTKVNLSLPVVKRAKELGALGIKDSSGDLDYLYTMIENFKDSPEFSVIVGTELFLPETILFGGHGVVSGGANMFPRLFVDLYEASLNKNFEAIQSLRSKVIKIHDTIYEVGKHSSRFIKGIKCALSVLDICDDYMALPHRKFRREEREKLEMHVKEMVQIQRNNLNVRFH